jgi:predicted ATP-binding protein involved in virulence
MKDIFITNMLIKSVRHLKDLKIPLSSTERQHLILTGRNGSGKTSVLFALKNYLQLIENQPTGIYAVQHAQNNLQTYRTRLVEIERDLSKPNLTGVARSKLLSEKVSYEQTISNQQAFLTKTEGVLSVEIHGLEFVMDLFKSKNFILKLFDTARLSSFVKPDGPRKISMQETYGLDTKLNTVFLQYLVNLRYDKLDAKENQEMAVVQKIEEWFDKFTQSLRDLFDEPQLQLVFERTQYNFNIVLPNREKFDLNTLSDGFSSVMNILTELLLRMNQQQVQLYDIQGIVMIDEIETHLHIELQKKILPFLIHFFPKIQFVVTTHSPFVLTSVKNAVIYDLEKQQPIHDLTGYSVEAVIKGYFNTDKYSVVLKTLVAQYEQLMSKQPLLAWEAEHLKSLKQYFKDLSYQFAPELKLKIQQIELAYLLK